MKRGISPLIGIVLLIGLVVALGAVTMSWGTTVLKKTTEGASKEKDVNLELAKEVGIEVTNVENVRVFAIDDNEDGIRDNSDYIRVWIENLKEKGINDFIVQLYAYDTVFSNTSVGNGLDGFDIVNFNVYFPDYLYIDFYADRVKVIPVVRDQYGELQVAEIQAVERKFACAGFPRETYRGDYDGNGVCNGGDIDLLYLAINDPDEWDRKYPCKDKDMNCDGVFNYTDKAFFWCILSTVDVCPDKIEGYDCVEIGCDPDLKDSTGCVIGCPSG